MRRNRSRHSHLFLYVFLFAVLPSCSSNELVRSESSSFETQRIPNGWIADFSYQEQLQSYLRRKAATAHQLGKQPIVYFFANWDWWCMETRIMMNQGDLPELFADKYTIMINYDYILPIVEAREGPNQKLVLGPTTIVPINSDGQLVGPAIYGYADPINSRVTQSRLLRRYFERIGDYQ